MNILALSALFARRGIRRGLLFFCPAILICVAAGLLGRSLLEGNRAVASPVRVAIVNQDGSFESRMLLNYLTDIEDYSELIIFTEAESDIGLEFDNFDAAIILPEDFFASVMDGGNRPFTVMLRDRSSLKSELLRIFTEIYSDMLKSGQTGVYASLSEARDIGEEEYNLMYREANLRFLGAMLNGRALFDETALSATGGAGIALSYGISAYIFIVMLSGVLFLDLWRGAAARAVLLRLNIAGLRGLKISLCYITGAAFPFLITGMPLGIAMLYYLKGELSRDVFLPGAIFAGLLLIFCAGSLMLITAVFTGNGGAGCLFLFIYNILGLFLSGGVIPWGWLSAGVKFLGSFTPHLYFTRLMTGTLTGNANPQDFLYCLIWLAAFGLINFAGLRSGGKAGARL